MALPVPPNAAGIVPPLPPANPPTVADARAAQEYAVMVRLSHQSGALGAATDADVVASAEYKLNVLSQPVAPAWFAPMKAQLNRIESMVGQVSNANKSNGYTYPFTIIHFNNNAPVNPGVDPTTVGLPALTDVAIIANLNNAQVDAYCQGYGIPMDAATYIERKQRIAQHIGCHDLGALA
ncbi:hypothetical protein BDZ89DRAFT_1162525 [Hymenopellis radicata]|nr:hypothetical protein BDZ89DRAFT_1162525 [Hymenopellis radicata]